MFNWLPCDNYNAQPSPHGTSLWTWWERAAARPQSLSITLQVREKYYGPHHAALRAHVTTVWQWGGHLRQAASRNLGMTATLIKRCQDPTGLLYNCSKYVSLIFRHVKKSLTQVGLILDICIVSIPVIVTSFAIWRKVFVHISLLPTCGAAKICWKMYISPTI